MNNKELMEAGEQAAKTKRRGGGRRDGNGSPIIGDNGVMVNKDENAAMCEYALNIFYSPKINLDDSEEVAQAIDGYFKDCINRGLRPGNLGLYAVLGLSKQDVSNAIHGYKTKLIDHRPHKKS